MLSRAEKGEDLTPEEADTAVFYVFYRAALSATIAGDVLTLPGSGRYKILPQTGITDNIASIVLTAEAVEGALVQLRPQTTGHTITLINGANLRLQAGVNVELSTIYSSVWLRHYGAGLWAQDSALVFIP